MTVTVDNIKLGACDVTFNAIDLGSTKGGVEVEISTEKFEVKVDQTGESVLKDIVTGTTVVITVPLAETDLTNLSNMLPQSVLQAATTPLPTGWNVNNVAGYAVGAAQIEIELGTNDPSAGDTFTFSGHTTVYRVTTFATTTLDFVNAGTNTGGLVAPIIDNEAITFVNKAAGVEIRTGVNVNLRDNAALLKLHPTGLGAGITDQDFVAFLAAPTADFSFKYEIGGERIYEVKFSCYPDTASNNRIAVFGVPV
jgi:hypothetical protein